MAQKGRNHLKSDTWEAGSPRSHLRTVIAVHIWKCETRYYILSTLKSSDLMRMHCAVPSDLLSPVNYLNRGCIPKTVSVTTVTLTLSFANIFQQIFESWILSMAKTHAIREQTMLYSKNKLKIVQKHVNKRKDNRTVYLIDLIAHFTTHHNVKLSCCKKLSKTFKFSNSRGMWSMNYTLKTVDYMEYLEYMEYVEYVEWLEYLE